MSKTQCDFVYHTLITLRVRVERVFKVLSRLFLLASDLGLSAELGSAGIATVSFRSFSYLLRPGYLTSFYLLGASAFKKRGHVPVLGSRRFDSALLAWGLGFLCLTSQSWFVLETIFKTCFFLPE